MLSLQKIEHKYTIEYQDVGKRIVVGIHEMVQASSVASGIV